MITTVLRSTSESLCEHELLDICSSWWISVSMLIIVVYRLLWHFCFNGGAKGPRGCASLFNLSKPTHYSFA